MASRSVAILKAVVCVAWADGLLSDPERRALDGVLAAAQLSSDEIAELRRYAAAPHHITELDVSSLTSDERRQVVMHAVALAYADNDYSFAERQTVVALCDRMGLSPAEAHALMSSASARMGSRSR